jgi:hypothetical protein
MWYKVAGIPRSVSPLKTTNIKPLADDPGARAGAFFTPPEVADVFISILVPHSSETV